jgi:hypothetical protein
VPERSVALTPGCQTAYTDHTGCHQLNAFLTIRPTRVITPGCQISYVEHTGYRMSSVERVCFDGKIM